MLLCGASSLLFNNALNLTVLYVTVLYVTVLYVTVLYVTVLYCTSLYCTSLYCTVLYCTLLNCTALHYTAGMAQPLSSFLMIVISCMTDVYAGVALTKETPERSIMDEKPRDPVQQPLVTLSLVAYSYLFYGYEFQLFC